MGAAQVRFAPGTRKIAGSSGAIYHWAEHIEEATFDRSIWVCGRAWTAKNVPERHSREKWPDSTTW